MPYEEKMRRKGRRVFIPVYSMYELVMISLEAGIGHACVCRLIITLLGRVVDGRIVILSTVARPMQFRRFHCH
jgi:hypothetical protein